MYNTLLTKRSSAFKSYLLSILLLISPFLSAQNQVNKIPNSIIPTIPPTTYCANNGIAPWELWLANVKFNTIDNTSEKFKEFNTLGYSDYTSLSTSIQKGQTYLLNITAGLSWVGNLPNTYCRTWMDWNGNNIFEDTELVFQNTNVSPLEAAIRVPTSAKVGATRMRVAMKWGSYPTVCETFEKGEVEDYNIVVTENGDQMGKDTLQIVNVVGDTLVQQGGNVTLKVTLKNTGSAPSDPNTPLSISQQRDGPGGKGPQPKCFELVSNYVPIGSTIQPNETVTLSYTFKMDTNFTHITPLYPPIYYYYRETNVTIGNRGNRYCDNIFNPNFNRDTIYRYHNIKAILDTTDLFLDILSLDTLRLVDSSFNYTIKLSNKGRNHAENAFVRIYVGVPNQLTKLQLSMTRGDVLNYEFLGEKYVIWQIPFIELGESLIANVTFTDVFPSSLSRYGRHSVTAICNQIIDNDETNNQKQVLFDRNSIPLSDLTLENLTVVTPSVLQGQTLDFKVDVKNIGSVNSGSSFNIKSYLSKDAYLSTDDYQNGIIPTGNYPPNFSQNQVAGAMTVSNTVAAGQYYLILKIDGNDEIVERDEVNNVVFYRTLITVQEASINGNADIALNLFVTPSVYRQWAVNTFRIFAKNNNNQAVTNIKIQFTYPEKTVNGGQVTASVGNWREYCAGNTPCYEWIIPTLAANTTATLDVPLFILDAVGNITATATLLTSTPSDGVAFNNTASTTISPATVPSQSRITNEPTQLVPLVVQKVIPTITEGDIIVDVKSLIEKPVRFDIYNALGKLVKSNIKQVQKGDNQLYFEVFGLESGLYLIQSELGVGQNTPVKFVKI